MIPAISQLFGNIIKLFKFLIAIFILSFILILSPGHINAAPTTEDIFPFTPGEKLTFELKWGIIKAGDVVLEVLPIETKNGINSYHFAMTVKSTPFIDVFYKVRDRIDSYVDLDMTHSLLYTKNQHQGRHKREVTVDFDWAKKEATYSNYGKKRKPISILPGSFDPLAVFYYSRLFKLQENAEIEIPVTDGKKSVIGIGRVIKRETVKLSSGTYDTFLIEPDLKHVGGVFKKSKNAKIKLWVTADSRRIPIKIKSKVKIGSFTGELVDAVFNDD
jgi:hypothetical protein